jgi:NAD-dependent deacetylase
MAFLRTKSRGRNGLFAPGLHELDSAEKVLKTYRASAAGRGSAKTFSVSRSRPQRPSPEPEDTDVRFRERLAQSKRISVLSGAGTSTESGIPDIRGRSPFWEQFRPEIFVLSHFLGREDVRMNYWAMDGLFLRLVQQASPNGIHRAIKRLQDQGRLECVVTQNVDGLFQRAGIRPEKTIEIHGSCFRVRCLACRTVYGRSELGLSYGLVRGVPRCPRCLGILKPDTVWMGEDVNPVLLGEAIYRFCASDFLLVIGTTLLVEPVASLPRVALEKGVELAIVNLTPTPLDAQSALVIREQAGEFFERSGLA